MAPSEVYFSEVAYSLFFVYIRQTEKQSFCKILSGFPTFPPSHSLHHLQPFHSYFQLAALTFLPNLIILIHTNQNNCSFHFLADIFFVEAYGYTITHITIPTFILSHAILNPGTLSSSLTKPHVFPKFQLCFHLYLKSDSHLVLTSILVIT